MTVEELMLVLAKYPSGMEVHGGKGRLPISDVDEQKLHEVQDSFNRRIFIACGAIRADYQCIFCQQAKVPVVALSLFSDEEYDSYE